MTARENILVDGYTDVLAQAICVRWHDPAAELMGLARIADAAVARSSLFPQNVCFAVPNRNWAAQMQRACNRVGLVSTVCMAPVRLSAAAAEALAGLHAAAAPDDADAIVAYAAFGMPAERAQMTARELSGLRGFTLVRQLGIQKIGDFAHALLHVRGDETPAQLEAVLRQRTAQPAPLPRVEVAHIVDYHDVARFAQEASFAWVFAVACVDGLVPGPLSFDEAAGEEARARAMEADRVAFQGTIAAAGERAVVSSFERIDAAIATQARIRFVRCKMEHGARLAMCSTTTFLTQAGAARPSTQGGQALLREFNLN